MNNRLGMIPVVTEQDYVCIEKDRLTDQSQKIAGLEARAEYKEKRIEELNDKINDMDKKLDILVQGFNDFKLDSNKGDVELELRLKTLETEQQSLKNTLKEKEANEQKQFNNKMAIIGVGLTIVTIGINIVFNLMH